jgi:flagellar protein FliJ
MASSKPFTFRLERVRELREHAEGQAKEHLAASLSQQMRGAAMLAQAAERLAAAKDTRREQAGGVLSAQDLVAHERWAQALERDHQAAEAALQRLEAEVDQRRAALGEASRNREVLERLKETRREEHAREMARREGAELDEIALRSHARRAA